MDNNNKQINNQVEELGKFKDIIEECEDYCLSIKKYEKEIEEQYKYLANINQKEYKNNYLIELKDFENFKEQINYNLFNTDITNYRFEMLSKFILIESKKEIVKQEKLKQKNITSIGKLFNLLKEGHQFILINKEFSENFVENKHEENYSYSLTSKELIISIKEQTLSFEHNKNIINYTALKNKQSEILNYDGQEYLNDENNSIKDETNNYNIDEIKDYIKDETFLNNNQNNNNINLEDNFDLVDWFVKYYLEEKKFKESLNNKEKITQYKLGFLIEQSEYDKWEKNMNLASLREILKNNLKEKENLSDDMKKQINQTLKNNNITQKFKIESLKFKTIEELKAFNKINNLILLNKELFLLINENEEKNINENGIQYVSQEKSIEFNINNDKATFFRFENLISSYIYYNFFLLTKIYIYQKNLHIDKKATVIYLLNKEMFQKYKECFNYKIFEQLIQNYNFDKKENEKQIYEFIEKKIPNTYINSIKENINSFKLDLKLISTKIVKKNNDIDFAYLCDFDSLFLEGGTFINFSKINEIKKEGIEIKEMRTIVKLFFIKEKILIIFEYKEKSYGQIGNIDNSDDENEFFIDYLISVKENNTGKRGTAILNDILKEEKDYNNFYECLYKTNHEDQFEYKISDQLIFYVLNFKNNNEQNSLNKENPFFVNIETPKADQQPENNINQYNISIPNHNNIQERNDFQNTNYTHNLEINSY